MAITIRDMTGGERSAPFVGDDPFALTRTWLAEAAKTEPNDPNAMQIATVDADGLPNVRTVLLKEIETDGFVFYTNYQSAKGQEIEATGQGAFVIHWKSLRRQVRARGLIERVSAEQSDAYFQSRDIGSRIGAHASEQSRPLDSRGSLAAKVAALTLKLGTKPRRPEHWGGYRLRPIEMEFWADGAFRLHDRFRWVLKNEAKVWQISRLNP